MSEQYEEPSLRRTGRSTRAILSLVERALQHPLKRFYYISDSERLAFHHLGLLEKHGAQKDMDIRRILGRPGVRLSNGAEIIFAGPELETRGLPLDSYVFDHFWSEERLRDKSLRQKRS